MYPHAFINQCQRKYQVPAALVGDNVDNLVISICSLTMRHSSITAATGYAGLLTVPMISSIILYAVTL